MLAFSLHASAKKTYLLPCVDRPERVEETNIFKQIRIEPEARWYREDGDDEDNEPNNRHGEEQSDETEHAHTQVPHALSQEKRP